MEGRSTSLLRSWRTIAWCVLLGAVLAIAVGLIVPKKYRAEAVLSTTESDLAESSIASLVSKLGPLAGLAGLGKTGGTTRAEAIAMLKSRQLARDFILTRSPIPWYQLSRTVVTPGEKRAPNEKEVAAAVDRFVRRVLDVREDRRSGMIVVSMTWTNRDLAAAAVNRLVAFCDEVLRATAITEARKSQQLLEAKISQSSLVELKQLMYRAYEQALQRDILAQVRQQYFLRVIDPATPPLPRDTVSPNWPLLILSGLGLGFACGFLLEHWRARRRLA